MERGHVSAEPRVLAHVSMDLPRLGARISLSGHLGTIKYSGSVDGTSGTWLGIEWDDPQRGKHDGVKDGRRYFECR